jgi:hypothetical protein
VHRPIAPLSSYAAVDLSRDGSRGRHVIIEMRSPIDADAVRILPYLRIRDASFLEGKDCAPHQVIINEVARSILAYTVTLDGMPAVIWGAILTSMLNDQAYVWMLGTRMIDDHPTAFLRHSRKAVMEMRKRFGILYGSLEPDFAVSERWLRWMGCTIEEGSPLKRFVLQGR